MLTVVGSIAFDSVSTPFGAVERELGGSAVYAALAASRFTRVRAVGAVGEDFGDEHYELLEREGIDTGAVQVVTGRDTFAWRGRYDFSLNAESLEVVLNALDGWRPRLSTEARESRTVFLAAMDPEIQLEVLAQVRDAECVAIDSISYWIATKRDALIEAISGADVVLLNDHEARQITEQPMLLTAAREIASWGPRAVVLRLGEYGCALLGPGGYFSIPGYPLERAADPTGGGDTFAGGFLGYVDLVRGDWATPEVLRRAITYGCVMSSFCIEDFGTRRIAGLTRQEIDYRFTDFQQMTHFEQVPTHPRPRDPFAAEHPAHLERPRPTATTGPRTAPPPTSATPNYRSPGRTPSTEARGASAPIWKHPNSFRQAPPSFDGSSERSRFASAPPPASFPPSSSTTPDRMGEQGVAGRGRRESMVYCVVASGASRKVAEALMRQFEGDPTVQVVVDRRRGLRRSSEERRRGESARPARITERRVVRHADGRRVAERRAVLGPCFRKIDLPRGARGHESEILLGSPLPQSRERRDDIDAARLALAHQAGDSAAFEGLFNLWFDRVYTYFSTVHARAHDIELAVNEAFHTAYSRLGEFTPALGSFRSWFGQIAAEYALAHGNGNGAAAETRTLDRWVGPTDLEALSWIGPDELVVLIRQLPGRQREVIALHYIFGLNITQVASAVGGDESDAAGHHDRALRFMSGCLTSMSRRPGFSGRLPMRERARYYPVTTGRKRALAA